MKTLYVSDPDGTLLRNGQKTSEYTNRVINTLVERGDKLISIKSILCN